MQMLHTPVSSLQSVKRSVDGGFVQQRYSLRQVLLKTTLNQSWMQDKEVQFYAQQINPYVQCFNEAWLPVVMASFWQP